MPTNYDGKTANVSSQSQRFVSAVSAANPCVITVTSALPAEWYTSGGTGGTAAAPLVNLTGIVMSGAAPPNGVYVATPISPTTFSVPVNTIGGTYTLGGVANLVSLASLYTIPSDGDPDNEASIDTWARTDGDRSQWLASRTGVGKLLGRFSYSRTDDTNATWATTGSILNNVWAPFAASITDQLPSSALIGPLTANNPSGLPFFALGIATGDVIHMHWDAIATVSVTGTWMASAYYLIGANGSSAPSSLGSMTRIPGLARLITTSPASLSFDAWIAPTIPAGDGVLWVLPAAFNQSGSTAIMNLVGSTIASFEVWSPTGMTQ